ncbi:hypothetical protein L7F22_034664 [Adiantum nelumboides]|nr:hypothetical protein [Adiantum nelumboides]MCO5580793.1 hypothetical protein [Adiantum nelumboides]
MKGSIFSPRTRHRLHKTFHNLRVTLLCSLLTFVVLRSSLGAGKFGTPAKDYDEIRHHLHNFRLRHHHKLLISRELAAAEFLRKDASRSTLSLPTLSSEELESLDDGIDRITDARRHKAFAPVPHIMLVTGSSLAKCDSAIEAQFLLKFLKNKMDYCHLQVIEIFFDAETDVSNEVAKLNLLRKLLLAHPEVEWLWWMDSTAMLTNMTYQLPYGRLLEHNVVKHNLGDGASSGIGKSTLVRNCEWTLEYLANADRRAQQAGEVLVDMEVYGPKAGLGSAWPFITDFKSCNVCSKDINLSCLSHIERAYSFADGQHRHVASL